MAENNSNSAENNSPELSDTEYGYLSHLTDIPIAALKSMGLDAHSVRPHLKKSKAGAVISNGGALYSVAALPCSFAGAAIVGKESELIGIFQGGFVSALLIAPATLIVDFFLQNKRAKPLKELTTEQLKKAIAKDRARKSQMQTRKLMK